MNPIDKLAWLPIQNRKVLYVRSRGKQPFYTPGGKREGNESNEQALMREIKEELDVELIPKTIEYLETFTAQADGKSEGVMVEIKCYKSDFRGTLTPKSEIEELAWLTSSSKEKTSTTGKMILDWLKERNYID